MLIWVRARGGRLIVGVQLGKMGGWLAFHALHTPLERGSGSKSGGLTGGVVLS